MTPAEDREKPLLSMIYFAVLRSDNKEGTAFACTSVTKLAEITGIKESILRYNFRERGRSYYEQVNPWIEVWVVPSLYKIERPQYKKSGFNRNR